MDGKAGSEDPIVDPHDTATEIREKTVKRDLANDVSLRQHRAIVDRSTLTR